MVIPNNAKHRGDTTYTKIFVGGLAWETKRETLKRYFEQFGEILEAVVITDRNTGRSKGYGFVFSYPSKFFFFPLHVSISLYSLQSLLLLFFKVTFKDPDSAIRACQNPYPVIDGRRANCNIAALGAQKFSSSAAGFSLFVSILNTLMLV